MKVLAFDFGASSGRAILGIYENGKLTLEEVHRFPNDPVMVNGTFFWDILRLFHEIKQGILKCVALGHNDISSIGIDTWGVDFGLLDENGYLLENPIHYRDKRTDGIMGKTFEKCSEIYIYEKTGIQFMPFNTIFQLNSLKLNRPEILERADTLLFAPDLLSYFLTGEKNAEYTIASTSQLLNAEKRDWDWDIIETLGFKKSMFPKIINPGTVRGQLTVEIAEELGVGRIDVIACASHDTASAVVSAPITKDEKSCYISCGTWSLLGAELNEPLINEQSFKQNFTNEGGFNNTIRFLKNISGLWLLQETRRQWNREGNNISFKDIDKMLETEHSSDIYIDPDFVDFATPGNMPAKINAFLKKSGQKLPETKGQMAICILESLAMAYKYYITTLEKILNTPIDTVHLIGGGVKDKNLCQFTANVTGKKVTAGPIEATAIGNITIQLIGKGQLPDMETARKMNSELEIYKPQNTENWNKKYQAFLKIKE